MELDLGIDELIKEVHYRPALWNKNCVEYADRRLKARLWDEVCENVIDNWKNLKMLQKNSISNEIQKRWRNVKDSFMKEQKKRTAGGYFGKKRQYIHAKALTFLIDSERYASKSIISLNGSDDDSDNMSPDQENTSKSSGRKQTRSENQDEDENVLSLVVKREKYDYDCDNGNSGKHNTKTDSKDDNHLEDELEKLEYREAQIELAQKKQDKDENSDRHFVEIKCDNWDNEINSPNGFKKHEDKRFVKVCGDVKVYDEDISFTEMLVPMLKKLNDDQKHFVKIEILNILYKAKRYHAVSSSETQTKRVGSEGNEDVAEHE